MGKVVIILVLAFGFINVSRAQSSSSYTTVEKSIADDAHVRTKTGTNYDSINYGWYSLLHCLRNAPGGNQQLFRTFIKMDISDIPDDAVIVNAVLYLYSNGNHSGANQSMLHQVNADWLESTITWSNMPGFTQSAGDPTLAQSTSSTQNYEVNVTGLMQNGLSSGLFNVMMKLSSEGAPNKALRFHSSESTSADKRPKLVITYTSSNNFVEVKEHLDSDFTWVNGNNLGIAYNNTEEGSTTSIEYYNDDNKLLLSESINSVSGKNFYVANLSSSLFLRDAYYLIKLKTNRNDTYYLRYYLK